MFFFFENIKNEVRLSAICRFNLLVLCSTEGELGWECETKTPIVLDPLPLYLRSEKEPPIGSETSICTVCAPL